MALPEEQRASFEDVLRFLRAEGHVLSRYPEIFWQQAANQSKGSKVSTWAGDAMSSSSWTPRAWLRLLNRPAGKNAPLLSFPHGLGATFRLAVDKTGRRILARGLAGPKVRQELLCFDGRTGESILGPPVKSSDANGFWICLGGRLLTLGTDGYLRLWTMEERSLANLPPGLSSETTSAATLSPDGWLLRHSNDTGSLEIWDLASGVCRNRLATDGPVQWLVAGAGAVRVVAGGLEGMTVFDGVRGRPVSRISQSPSGGNPLLGMIPVAVTPDGQRVASGGPGGTIDVWNAESGRKLLTVVAHPGESPPHLQAWREHSAKNRARGLNDEVHSTALPAEVNTLAISPDGRAMASGGMDGRIRIWEVTTGEGFGDLPGHSHSVNTVAFTRDGTRLVSGGNDPFIRVWKSPVEPASGGDSGRHGHHPSDRTVG